MLVSNRGPYRLRADPNGTIHERTVGGLATALLPLIEKRGGAWITSGDPAGRYSLPVRQPNFELVNLALTEGQIRGFYHGLSNNALWPLCHCFLGRVYYDPSDWRTYEIVNQIFARAAVEEIQANDIVWVHDYQLARAPYYIRQDRPQCRLAFFWHIPFPPLEIFRTLPWRKQLLEGLLSCNLVGFHIDEYTNNFIEACCDLLGARQDGDMVYYGTHTTRVIARPIGIDFEAFQQMAGLPATVAQVQDLRQALGRHSLIVGVERMDYTKGIVERLKAVEQLLTEKPQWRGKFTMVQIVTPSRETVVAYRDKKREIDETVGRINGQFSNDTWIPIRYLYRAFSPTELVAYYRAADIALVTPLRDGLNLVAKEFVATHDNEQGVLILSEFAGVHKQLPEAVLTNPYSRDDLAHALEVALQMPSAEQHTRMAAMRSRIQTQDILWWATPFLEFWQ